MNPELVNLLQVLASILCFAFVGVVIGYLFHARRAVRAASYEIDQLHKLLDRQEQAYTSQSERLRLALLRITRLQVSDGVPVMPQSYKNELTDQIDKRRAEAELRLKKEQEFKATSAKERRHANQTDDSPMYNQQGFLYGVQIPSSPSAGVTDSAPTTERTGTFDGGGSSGDWDRSSSSSDSSSSSSNSNSSSSSSSSDSSSSCDSGSSSSGGCD